MARVAVARVAVARVAVEVQARSVAAATAGAASAESKHSRQCLGRRDQYLRAARVHLAHQLALQLRSAAGAADDEREVQLRLGDEQLVDLVRDLQCQLARRQQHQQLQRHARVEAREQWHEEGERLARSGR